MAGGIRAIGNLPGKVSSANALVVALDGDIPGYVQGTGVAGRVAYWTDTDTIGSDADFTFASDVLGVPTVRVGDGSAAAPGFQVGSTATGLFIETGTLGFAVNGTKYATLSSGGFRVLDGTTFAWSSNPGITASDLSLARAAARTLTLGPTTGVTLRWTTPDLLEVRNFANTAAGNLDVNYLQGLEITAPSAPAANGWRLFAQDNGAGKTQLMVLFASGVAQQVAIEP